jgi:hypothetical protein
MMKGLTHFQDSDVSQTRRRDLLLRNRKSKQTQPIVVPNPPLSPSATAGTQQATITFSVPSNNGGSAILDYTATSSPGARTATGAASPLTVTGLTTGTPYTFTVTARNAIGTGAASVASNSVTPT